MPFNEFLSAMAIHEFCVKCQLTYRFRHKMTPIFLTIFVRFQIQFGRSTKSNRTCIYRYVFHDRMDLCSEKPVHTGTA
jgi:hypothetical protein